MQRRRDQLARRRLPEGKAASVPAAALAVLLAAAWMAGSAALETTTNPSTTATEAENGTGLSILQCKCFSDSSLNCSFRSLKNVTEEQNSCSRNISRIDVSHNQLESLDGINIWFGSELNASHNLIKEIHSSSFKSVVEVLDVSWNNVSTLEVKDMQGLRILNVSHNQLERVQLPKSCALEVLDVSNNLLVEFAEGIRECRNLSVLNVFNNALQTFPDVMIEEFLEEAGTGPKSLMLDLRGNEMPPSDKRLRSLVDNEKLNFSTQPGNCTCATLSRGLAVLTLCLSTMCTNDTEYWTSANGSTLQLIPTLFPTSDDTPQNGSTCEGDCGATTDPSVFNCEKNSTVSDETTTVTVTSTDISSPTVTVPSVSPTVRPETELPDTPRVQGDAPRGSRAQGPQQDVLLTPTLPPRDTPPPPTDTPIPPPDTGGKGRKRRSLWVTLALTVVVLAAAALGVYVLLKLYRRRQRQLLEERSQRIPLQPLVATPRSLRAQDDDFVP